MNSSSHPAGKLAPYSLLEEPLLLFSSRNEEAVDEHPLRGLLKHGPYTENSLHANTDRVRIAIVGPDSAKQERRALLRSVISSQEPSDRRDYVPPFPGFEMVFKVPLVPAADVAQLSVPEVIASDSSGSPTAGVQRIIGERMRQLAAVRDQYDVVVFHLPDAWSPGLRTTDFDAHHYLKAVGAELGIPTQVVNDRVFTFPYAASRSWRLAIALYVKAGGMPWRLAPIPGVPDDSAYIGLAHAFRGDPRNAEFVTCCSQVFDADGGGMQFVAYDARAPVVDSADFRRNPHLDRSDMRAVLARSLDLYRRRNGGSTPRRVVLHRKTAFRDEELAGVSEALAAVEEVECIQVKTNVAWRGVWLGPDRGGDSRSKPDGYPVHRGTMVPLSGTSALTWVAGNAPSASRRGSSYYQGGKSIPAPIVLTRQMGGGPLELIAAEALALTKMDWNNDALYDPDPVTIGYSQRLAKTIASVPSLPRATYPYRMFM